MKQEWVGKVDIYGEIHPRFLISGAYYSYGELSNLDDLRGKVVKVTLEVLEGIQGLNIDKVWVDDCE